jgi:hypothetical protein
LDEAVMDADETPHVWLPETVQPIEAAIPEAIADPFDDLQPMLDLRFPEEPASAETVGPAAQAEETDVVALADEAASLVECEPVSGDVPLVESSAEIIDTAFEPVEASNEQPPSEPPVPEISDAEPAFGAGEQLLPSDDVAVTAADQPSADWDAGQKIADEANATAQALETLKQLIAHKMPSMEIGSPTDSPDAVQVLPPPIQAFPAAHAMADREPGEDAELEPIDLPAIAREHRYVGRGPAWQGFLAGFMASWAIGGALYVYLVFA